jgi:putative oxidoreductase
MNPSQTLARPLLASMFVVGGIDSIRNSEGKVKAADAVVKPLSQTFPAIPSDTETLIKFNGAVQVGAGLLLATGRFRRLAALALIGSIVPTTYAGHRFWEETDEDRHKQQMIHFLKNLGLLGGLILEVSIPNKQTSDGHKKVKAATSKTASSKAASSKAAGRRAAHKQAAKVQKQAAKVQKGSAQLASKTKRLERRAERRARSAARDASKIASRAASEVAKRSHEAARQAGDVAGQYGAAASDRAGQIISYAQEQLSNLNAA